MAGVEKADAKELLEMGRSKIQERGIIKRSISERQDGMENRAHDEELACPIAHMNLASRWLC